jgi:hypothetical protein
MRRRLTTLIQAIVFALTTHLGVDYEPTREAAIAKSWRSGMTIAGRCVRSKQREDGDLRPGAVVSLRKS